jgi:hypothetical protein
MQRKPLETVAQYATDYADRPASLTTIRGSRALAAAVVPRLRYAGGGAGAAAVARSAPRQRQRHYRRPLRGRCEGRAAVLKQTVVFIDRQLVDHGGQKSRSADGAGFGLHQVTAQ